MSQHDYAIDNDTGATVRADINAAFDAIKTNNAGATDPDTSGYFNYAYEWWADTSTGLLKLRNGANSAWITICKLAGGFYVSSTTDNAAARFSGTTGDMQNSLLILGDNGDVSTTGSQGGFFAYDRSTSGSLALYRDAGTNRFWDDTDADFMSYTDTDSALYLPKGRLKFPASQNASSDANTLDDYEEGSWTPSVGGTATYTTQVGYYTKIGNSVTVSCYLQINAIGTGSTFQISGLPFAVAANSPGTSGVYCTGLAVSTYSAIVYAVPSQSYVRLLGFLGAGATQANLTMGDSTTVIFSVTYRTS